MEKNNTWAIICLAVLTFLVGGLLTYAAFPREVITEKLVDKPVITEKLVYVDKPVEVVKTVEVVKEVAKEVPMDLEATFLEPAIKEFMTEVEDEDSYLVCDEEEYDFDDIAVKKIYDGYSVSIDDAKDGEYTVSFTVKLKYLDGDVEEKCYNTFDVEVTYPKDNDDEPEVEIV